MKRLVILGKGGYGRTLEDVASQLGYDCVFLDDSISEHPLSSFTEYIPAKNSTSSPDFTEEVEFIPAFGNNAFRLEWIDKICHVGGKLATLIHPTAYVSPTASIALATVILPHAIINTDVVLERGTIVNLGAIVDHGCVIEEGCHICLGAIVKGENRVKALSKIEAGEVIEARRFPVNKPAKE